MYVSGNQGAPGSSIFLNSPLQETTVDTCLTFYFNMFVSIYKLYKIQIYKIYKVSLTLMGVGEHTFDLTFLPILCIYSNALSISTNPPIKTTSNKIKS